MRRASPEVEAMGKIKVEMLKLRQNKGKLEKQSDESVK
jgi:hypothetical protein